MADYISALTGQQMDIALTDMANYNSEAWAVGQRNGIDVSSGDETYENNSKYYANYAATVIQGTVTEAVRWDTAQTLSSSQKAQARDNIAAAPLASPTFTGTPAAPTASQGTSTTQVATTAFAVTEIQTYLNRSNAVNAADADVTVYKARASALFSTETSPSIEGTISWTYE